MLGAVIRNGNNTLVVDLPLPVTELQNKLNSIGIQETSDKIKLSDEDGNPIRVKLYATTAEEAHLLPLLAPNRTLADANSSVAMLHRANRSFQMRLKFFHGKAVDFTGGFAAMNAVIRFTFAAEGQISGKTIQADSAQK